MGPRWAFYIYRTDVAEYKYTMTFYSRKGIYFSIKYQAMYI